MSSSIFGFSGRGGGAILAFSSFGFSGLGGGPFFTLLLELLLLPDVLDEDGDGVGLEEAGTGGGGASSAFMESYRFANDSFKKLTMANSFSVNSSLLSIKIWSFLFFVFF